MKSTILGDPGKEVLLIDDYPNVYVVITQGWELFKNGNRVSPNELPQKIKEEFRRLIKKRDQGDY